MAKRIIALCVFFCVLFCGCAAKRTCQKELCADFQADFTAEYNGLLFGGKLLNTRQGNTNLRFTRPQTLRDLELAYKNGEVCLRRTRAVCTADEGYLPDVSFSSVLRQILHGMADDRAQLVKADENCCVYSLQTACGSCEIKTDLSGLPKSFYLQKPKLLAQFSNASKIGEEQ